MGQIATRYANALYAKLDDRSTTKVLHDMDTLQNWCDKSEEFLAYLRNSLISREDAVKIMDKLSLSAKFHPLTKDFLNLVARNRRLVLLPQIIEVMMSLHDQEKGIVKATLTSAQKLAMPQLKNIQTLLKRILGKTPKTLEVIDPNVLGGFKITVGSYLIDATIKTQLKQIQMLLKEA